MKAKALFPLALLTLTLAACTSENRLVTPETPSPVAQTDAPTELTFNGARTPENFEAYVAFLKQKALAAGISPAIVNGLENINYIERAVSLDRAQAEKKPTRADSATAITASTNPNSVTNYLKKVLTVQKVNQGKAQLAENATMLAQVEVKYGVPAQYIVALWGMESGFGANQGKYDVLSVLVTLAFEGRREAMFTQQFIYALQMLQNNTISRDLMKGSYAGAMGQTQFMPSAYLAYAADGDNDGRKNIWTSKMDAFSSIASYLSTVGWNAALPWGIEVGLKAPIDLSFSGIEIEKGKLLTEWQAMGVYLKNPTKQEKAKYALCSDKKMWLVMPDKADGRAFLVTDNYRTIMHWNKSHNFAISIGKFADKLSKNADE